MKNTKEKKRTNLIIKYRNEAFNMTRDSRHPTMRVLLLGCPFVVMLPCSRNALVQMLDNFFMTVSIIQRGLQLLKLLLIIVDKTLVHLVCLEIII